MKEYQCMNCFSIFHREDTLRVDGYGCLACPVCGWAGVAELPDDDDDETCGW